MNSVLFTAHFYTSSVHFGVEGKSQSKKIKIFLATRCLMISWNERNRIKRNTTKSFCVSLDTHGTHYRPVHVSAWSRLTTIGSTPAPHFEASLTMKETRDYLRNCIEYRASDTYSILRYLLQEHEVSKSIQRINQDQVPCKSL